MRVIDLFFKGGGCKRSAWCERRAGVCWGLCKRKPLNAVTQELTRHDAGRWGYSAWETLLAAWLSALQPHQKAALSPAHITQLWSEIYTQLHLYG